jgi:outer membrane protein insertion porin family
MINPTKLLRSAFLALALLFLAPVAGIGGSLLGVEAAQAATVSKISVVGNKQVDDAAVIKYLAVAVGEPATSANINASIEALTATGLFKTVSITMQGSTLVVKVSENSIVASVLFEGNQRYSDANLVAMIDLMNRGTVDEAGIARDVASIKKAYQDVGYTTATVTTRLDPVGDGRVRVVFVINEGGRSGIAAVNFTGNNAISGWTLKSIITTHETSWLSWLLRDDNYTQAQLDGDRVMIQQYYANHGFPDAQVTSAVAEYDAKRAGYFINFTIVEGDHYKFGKIDVETSISGFDANALRGVIRTRQGDGFSASDMGRTSNDMAVEATNIGYPFADVRPRIERDPATGTFNVTYLVDEGQHLYVERVNITGNTKTRDFVIRRELPFAEGDPFNKALVTQGRANIQALGFFSKVDVTAEQGSGPDKVILNIAVAEQSTGDYGVTAGFDSASGILGELSLTERNFLGRGQYVKASIGASQTGKSFDFSFTEPYFMGLKVSAGFDLYRHITDESTSNVYGTTTTGGQVRFGLPVTRDIQAQLFTGLDQTTVADANLPNTDLFGLNPDGKTFTKAWVGYTLTYNGLDDVAHPTEGLYATLSQQYDGVDYNFIKTEAKARYFAPVNADAGLIASLEGQAGIINSFSSGGVNPIEAFRYGNQIVRGFQVAQMGPRSLAKGEVLGFTQYAAVNAELDFPIPMLPETYGLKGAIWGDAAIIGGQGGSVAVSAGSVDQPLKSAVGGSILWDSPFGPLRGDIAYVITKATDDKTQVFSLTLKNLL